MFFNFIVFDRFNTNESELIAFSSIVPKELKMNKAQCFIASTLCIAFGLTFTYPLAQFAPPLVAVVYGSVLIGLGGVFYLIGVK